MARSFRVKLKKSTIGCTQKQRDTVRCLGLRYREHEIVVPDNVSMRGLIFKVQHLLDVRVEGGK